MSYPPQPTSAPSATQPSYGSPSYGSPAYGSQPAYPQQGMATQPGASPYGPGAPVGPATSAQGGGKMGLFALIAAILALIIGIVLDIVGWQMLKSAIESDSNGESVGWVWLAQLAPTTLGIVAIVLGIIAIAKKSARGMGIAAIVVAVLAPIIVFAIWMFTLAGLAQS